MKKWGKIIKASIVVGVLALISVGCFLLYKQFGIFGYSNIEDFRAFIESFGMWGILIYVGIRVLFTIFMSFIPSVSMIFDLIAVALYGANWKAFVISLVSIAICSLIMYVLGRTGANKLFKKIIGAEDLEKANKLIKEKGVVFYFLAMCFGGFPDDALVCMAGITKMNIIVFLITTIIGRSIGCAFTIFGISFIPFDTFTRPYDWFVFIVCAGVSLYVIIKIGLKISEKINDKLN